MFINESFRGPKGDDARSRDEGRWQGATSAPPAPHFCKGGAGVCCHRLAAARTGARGADSELGAGLRGIFCSAIAAL